MAGKTRELKGRIKAVGNIQRITKTMQMIATARFQSLHKQAAESQAYADKLAEVVGELAVSLAESGSEEAGSHPLLERPAQPVGRSLVLAVTSNRGLCGSYNAGVLRTLTRFLADEFCAGDRSLPGLSEKVDFELIGKKGQAFCKFNGIRVAHFHAIADAPSYGEVNWIAENFMQRYSAGDYDHVYVVATRFESMSRQVPEINRLLPIEPPKAEPGASGSADATVSSGSMGSRTVYEFSPDPAELLAAILPTTVKTRLYQMLNESVVSEQLARMVAMKAATDAAGKQKKLLSRQYNRARQTAITTELTEIIGGATALE